MAVQVDQTQLISDQVVGKFRNIPEVREIYQEIDSDILVYWVFSSEQKYDDELLERMIAQEMAVMDAFRHTHFDFRYIPLIACPEPPMCISQLARLIYKSNG